MILLLVAACAPPPLVVARTSPYAGCTVDQVVDVKVDGVADWLWTAHYDDAGRVLVTESDPGMTGAPQGAMHYTYDAGQLVEQVWDGDGDGSPDITTRHRYVAGVDVEETSLYGGHDEPKDRIEKTWADGLEMTETHYGDDGKVTDRAIFGYDAAGRKVTRSDDDGVGVPVVRTWVYDDNGNAISEALDTNGDGVDDRVQVTDYDASGRPTQSVWDNDKDGRADNFAFWSYDCPG